MSGSWSVVVVRNPNHDDGVLLRQAPSNGTPERVLASGVSQQEARKLANRYNGKRLLHSHMGKWAYALPGEFALQLISLGDEVEQSPLRRPKVVGRG